MSTKEEKANLLKFLGLNDQKVEETLKNETLSSLLIEIVNTVQSSFIFINCNLYLSEYCFQKRQKNLLKRMKTWIKHLKVYCTKSEQKLKLK